MSIEEFLSRLKLEQYTENLKLNGINNLNEITEESLARCNIDKIGHKKRILTELKNINQCADITSMAPANDLPPELPPKRSSSTRINSRTPPIPPTRSMSTKPRISSVAQGGSLSGPSVNSENYHMLSPVPPPSIQSGTDASSLPTIPSSLPPIPSSLPPIPPRIDRGEPNIDIQARRAAPSPPKRSDVDEDTKELPATTGILLDFELPPPPPVPAPRAPRPSPTVQVPSVVQVEEIPPEVHNEIGMFLHIA